MAPAPKMYLKLAGSLALASVVASCSQGSNATIPRAPTYAKDVAPIVFEHCLPCHREGQGAPFSLGTFDEARRRADKIAHATQMHHMPPWLPDPVDPGFVDERRLTPDQIETIRRWADAGAPEGNQADLPPRPAFPGTWQLGPPDLVVTPDRAYTLAAGHDDVF